MNFNEHIKKKQKKKQEIFKQVFFLEGFIGDERLVRLVLLLPTPGVSKDNLRLWQNSSIWYPGNEKSVKRSCLYIKPKITLAISQLRPQSNRPRD